MANFGGVPTDLFAIIQKFFCFNVCINLNSYLSVLTYSLHISLDSSQLQISDQ